MSSEGDIIREFQQARGAKHLVQEQMPANLIAVYAVASAMLMFYTTPIGGLGKYTVSDLLPHGAFAGRQHQSPEPAFTLGKGVVPCGPSREGPQGWSV